MAPLTSYIIGGSGPTSCPAWQRKAVGRGRASRQAWKATEPRYRRAWTHPESNGVVEGHVHRLKRLKRQCYGRAGFATLRARVLSA